MSVFGVEKALYDLSMSGKTRRAYTADPAAFLATYNIADAEAEDLGNAAAQRDPCRARGLARRKEGTVRGVGDLDRDLHLCCLRDAQQVDRERRPLLVQPRRAAGPARGQRRLGDLCKVGAAVALQRLHGRVDHDGLEPPAPCLGRELEPFQFDRMRRHLRGRVHGRVALELDARNARQRGRPRAWCGRGGRAGCRGWRRRGCGRWCGGRGGRWRARRRGTVRQWRRSRCG